MFSISKNFVRFNDLILEILYQFSEATVKNTEGLKTHLQMDMVLRKDGILYFCKIIPEAEILLD